MKTVIITGVAGNLGRAVAEKFLEAGFRVVGTVFPGHPSSLQAENFEAFEVDLLQEDQSGDFVNAIIRKYNTIEVAILTAGGFAMGKIADTKTSDMVKQFQLNVETAYNIARPVFIQIVKQEYGRLFFVGSRPGLDMTKSKGMVAYGTSKSILFRLAELMNEESKGLDVVTTMLVPSTIDTPENRKSMPAADFNKWVSPASIADVIIDACGPRASIVREPVIKLYKDS